MAPPSMGLGFPRPTKQYHTSSYRSISPSRPELSVKGQTVLITGGATGIGLATSKAFAQAGASSIVLLARSQGPMTEAKKQIESQHPETKVLAYSVSITEYKRVREILKEIDYIDILILNAGIANQPEPILDTSPKDLEELFAVNAVGPLNLINAFMALTPRTPETPRTIVYTSTAGVQAVFPGVGAYNASKAAMTYLMRCLGEESKNSNVRTFSLHPAFAFTDMAKDVLGLNEDQFSYDSVDLPAHYAVWLCSSEADFFKGKFVWSHWDVQELEAKRSLIENDPSQLTIGLVQDKMVD